MIKHIILWTLKPEYTAEQKEEIKKINNLITSVDLILDNIKNEPDFNKYNFLYLNLSFSMI